MRRPARLPLDQLAPYLLEMPQPKMPTTGGRPPPYLNWRAIFGNEHPVEVEVGSGKGLFLVTAGCKNPDINFLGVEVVRALQLYIATRLAKRNLTNVRVTGLDARHLFATHVPSGSLQAVHVYFPDPWWKKRHKKRRVFTPEFAADCERTLQPGGRLLIASDVEEYFHLMLELVDARPGLRRVSTKAESGPPQPEDVLTNFERKARQKSGTVWRAGFERIQLGSPIQSRS